MSDPAQKNQAEWRYLLGELSEEEKALTEEAFFADDSTFEAIELAEDELLDAYVRGELSPAGQGQFEARLRASPRLMERLNFATALAEKADSLLLDGMEASRPPARWASPAPTKPGAHRWTAFFVRRPAWGMALACAVLILAMGVAFVSMRSRQQEAERLALEKRVEQQLEQDRLSREQRTRDDQLAAQRQREKDKEAADRKVVEEAQRKDQRENPLVRSLSAFATVLLTPGSVRGNGNGQSELILKPETTTARLRLALEKNEYSTYSVTIKSVDEIEVFHLARLKSHNAGNGPELLLTVPSKRLAPNTYIVRIVGITSSGQAERVSDYELKVTTKK